MLTRAFHARRRHIAGVERTRLFVLILFSGRFFGLLRHLPYLQETYI
jgi:hypothetical protein